MKILSIRTVQGPNLVQLGYGVHRKLIQAARSSQTSAIAMEVAQDKDITKLLLKEAFVPLPDSRVVYSADRFILREDAKRRGRKPGEMLALMSEVVNQERPQPPCTTIADQVGALEHVSQTMEPGEVAVLFYDEIEPVTEWLKRVGGTPAPMVGQAITLTDVPRLFKFSNLARAEEAMD